MKQKFISLGLALAMLLGAAGCNITTPATVGTIGGVEIPAGIYLLAQYNAYTSAASNADLATGESANDVNAVLRAQVTGTIGDEEVTTDGADYISRLTMRSIEYYAAVEAQFDALGATLEDAATAEAASTADSMWESSGDIYQANGIGKETVEKYLLNAQKATALLDLTYGENGSEPIPQEEYENFLEEDCMYIDSLLLPLIDTSTYTTATGETADAIDALADQALADLEDVVTPDLSSAEAYTELYMAATNYIPQVMSLLGNDSFDANQSLYYAGSQLYLPDAIASYDDGEGGNLLLDSLGNAENGQWVKINLGSAIGLMRKTDPLEQNDLSTYQKQYDLVSAIRGDDLRNSLYAAGAAMEHDLDQGAINTYKASNIKRSV